MDFDPTFHDDVMMVDEYMSQKKTKKTRGNEENGFLNRGDIQVQLHVLR